jgi:hypothetical protein
VVSGARTTPTLDSVSGAVAIHIDAADSLNGWSHLKRGVVFISRNDGTTRTLILVNATRYMTEALNAGTRRLNMFPAT